MNTLMTLFLLGATLLPADSALWQLNPEVYRNPATRQWMLPASHSQVGTSYRHGRQSRPVDPQMGEGETLWTAGAETYLKHRSSTLWGDAAYSNGTRINVVWNETSDPSLLYPYLTADSIGGDMKMERYRFSGGYADRSDRWGWGVTMGYDAGLSYRNVDPRPRNVTGTLDISAGGALRVYGDYHVGMSINYRKYKQSGDMDFKSQLGVEKIYHLTGLATHYHRFAGVGLESYYNGRRFGMTADLVPTSGHGLSLSAAMSRFTFDKVLTGLNKLPLASVWHNDMTIEAAYKSPGPVHDWGIAAHFNAYRRHGNENQFGDASSGVYPLIASIDTYADNSQCIGASALWQYHPMSGGMLLWIKIAGDYRHRAEAYVSPRRRREVNRGNVKLEGLGSWAFARFWRASVNAAFDWAHPFGHTFDFEEAEVQQPAGLVTLERYRYAMMTHDTRTVLLSWCLQRQFNGALGLSVRVGWQHTAYRENIADNRLSAALSVYF